VGIWKRRLLPPAPPVQRPAAIDRPPADFLAPPQPQRAMLGHDSEVSGKLSFVGPTRIDGALRGEVHGTDALVIGESGYVKGTIRATSLVVLGRVDGNVLGAERVEIGPRGALHGTVETRALVVHDGAQLDGDCRIAPLRAKVLPLRPRSEAPSPES
jgi:cytoskeletal protein CcmA (bactofilin family)